VQSKAGLTPERQLAGFIDKFTPEMAAIIRAARKSMRKLLPGAVEMVYDNYNFFVIGYGPTDRTSEAVFSLAAHASGLRLFFLQGANLPDPDRLLEGKGNKVRSVVLKAAADLKHPDLRALMAEACDRAKVPVRASSHHRLIIKSVSAKQRPRRAPAQSRFKGRGK
jgi:hypothetical protein